MTGDQILGHVSLPLPRRRLFLKSAVDTRP
jgi:hypothetical protein